MCDQVNFSTFFKVEECTGSLVMSRGGWHLSLRHRHSSGSWSNSCVDIFECLSLEELLQVLEAVVGSWADLPPALHV